MATAQLGPGAFFAGRFRVERLLGRGGMGAVYEVVDDMTKERLALKVLAPQLVPDAKHRERFAKEVRIGAEIQSPRIVKVVDAGIDASSDTPWLAMELLRGESLGAFVRLHGKLDALRALDVLGQIAEAIEAAHAAGVIHRDLKPDNVFVVRAPDGGLDVRVLDFGIAKIATETGGRTTGALGSPLWMAPEEAKKEPLTAAVDVWAFGLLAFFVLTGAELWRSAASGSSIAQALNEVLIDPIPNPTLRAHSAGVTLPAGFENWFGGCVVRDPSLRFQTIRDAFDALRRTLSEAPTAPDAVRVPPPPHSAPSPSGVDSMKLLIVGASAVVCAIAAAVAASHFAGGPSPSSSLSATQSVTSVVVTAPEPTSSASVPADTAPAVAPKMVPPVDPVLSTVDDCLQDSRIDCARRALEPTVFAKTATAEQAQVLYDLCETDRDPACQTRVAKAYPKLNRDVGRALTVHVAQPPPPAYPGKPPAGSLADQARSIMATDPAGARALLEPRVFAKTATSEEARLLWNVCKALKDSDCRDKVDRMYPGLPH